MIRLNDITQQLPEMLTGNGLLSEMAIMPEYDEEIRNENQAVRLLVLNDIYKVYVPSRMSQEIYSRLYLALIRSLQKKGSQLVVQQQKQNYRAIQKQEYQSIIGGCDSFTIIGTSGIGKSSAISRAIILIGGDIVINVDKPYTRIIPVLSVQCPFDCSVKGMLLEILRKIDEKLRSNYYEKAVKVKATTDLLIGSVSQIALNHVGLLVVDEIQNVVNHKNGRLLVGVLTQLINNAGISIALVGTPESAIFFEQAQQLARRAVGLQYAELDYDTDFISFCRILFQYQYVKHRTEITDSIIEWLYQHSGGNVSVVVALIHDAQELSILNGREILDIESLNEAYQKRLSMLHGFINSNIKRNNQTSKLKKEKLKINIQKIEEIKTESVSISELVSRAKETNTDIVLLLKESLMVEEVAV